MKKLNGLDLFTGIGGLSIALRDYVRPVAYCEIDSYCQAIILSRIASGELPSAAIWDDIKTLQGKDLPSIEIIYGGFPCQDISCAGNGKGLEGKSSGLFFEMLRLAKEIKPSYLFIENVPAITTRGGLRIVKEIASLGYDCRWGIISAASIGAMHKRNRWFLLANSNSRRIEKQSQPVSIETQHKFDCYCNSKSSQQADTQTESITREQNTWGRHSRHYWPFTSREHWQKTVSEMDKCSHGVSNHVDRLRALGNAVVPMQAREAFQILSGLK